MILRVRGTPRRLLMIVPTTGSREQNYRPEDCGICHAVLVGKKGRGFWEGGKGASIL